MRKILTAMVICACNLAYTQDGLPSNPEPGKCYAKCVTPDEWKDEIVKVLKKPAYTVLEIIPAEYEEQSETVIVIPESKKIIYEPAEYETVYDTIRIKDPYNKLTIEKEEFEDAIETVEVKSKLGKWVAGAKDPDCPSIDPDDCRVLHYREDPPVMQDVNIEKKIKDQTTNSNEIEGKFKVVERQQEVKAAGYREEIIPAVTKEVKKMVLVKDETTKETEIPAVYEEVHRKVLVKAGGVTEWREVPCTLPREVHILEINYSLGSALLSSSAKRQIDNKILPALKENPGSILEVASHTDSRGSADSNRDLSNRRSKTVIEYLMSKGIPSDRLLATGYGESRLINECKDGVNCSESKHLANRRTEFKIY